MSPIRTLPHRPVHRARVLTVGALALLATACASAQGPVARTEAAVASTAPTLTNLQRRLIADTMQQVLATALADSSFPGAIAVVGRHDGVIAMIPVGHLDWAPSPAPDEHTLWDLASLTKVVGMTSAMMQLVEEHKVDLDAPVQRYLPDWTGRWKELVTVRHLITHSSGLPAFKPYDRQTHNADTLAMLMFDTPLDTLPGVKMVYSDIGAYVAGRIVEKVSGETLDQYVVRHVFRPIGMDETMYRPPASLLARIAPTEFDSTRGGLVRGKVHDERAYYLGGISAHAGIFSSAHDLARFARMYLNGGELDGVRIFEPATIREFTTVQDSSFSNRALGWEKPTGRNSAGHLMSPAAFGHTGFTGTSIWMDPTNDMFVILLSNRVDPSRERGTARKIAVARTNLADAVMGIVTGRTPSIPASRSSTTRSGASRP